MLLDDIAAFASYRYGDTPAILWRDRSTSFKEQYQRVQALRRATASLGVPGDRVGILSENRPEYAECYYGIPGAGRILTLLNYRLSPEELAKIMAHADIRVLICEQNQFERVAPFLAGLANLEVVVRLGDGSGGDIDYESFLSLGDDEQLTTPSPDDPAWLVYTSGTTGTPKGVLVTHRNIITALSGWLVEIGATTGELQLLPFPMCHIAGIGVPGYCMRGCTSVLNSSFDAPQLLSLVGGLGVAGTALAPTMIRMLLRASEGDSRPLSSLRLIQYGSAPMPADLLASAIDAMPDSDFATGFGMTELAGNVLWLSGADHRRALEDREGLLRSVGRPMIFADLRLVDDEMREVGVDEVGELVVRGDQVSPGYFRDPDRTQEAWRGGWFHTGDLMRRDADGYFYIVERKKDIIITGGENVYPRDVEVALEAHPGVQEVAVIGIPDPVWIEQVSAVIVVKEDMSLTEGELIEYCQSRLSGFKRPRRIFFVNELPKTVSGKVQKHELRRIVAEEP